VDPDRTNQYLFQPHSPSSMVRNPDRITGVSKLYGLTEEEQEAEDSEEEEE
jgi:hypothetical protein